MLLPLLCSTTDSPAPPTPSSTASSASPARGSRLDRHRWGRPHGRLGHLCLAMCPVGLALSLCRSTLLLGKLATPCAPFDCGSRIALVQDGLLCCVAVVTQRRSMRRFRRSTKGKRSASCQNSRGNDVGQRSRSTRFGSQQGKWSATGRARRRETRQGGRQRVCRGSLPAASLSGS